MRKKLSAVMLAHYFSLTWRSVLCVVLLILWIGGMVSGKNTIMYHFEEHSLIMTALWVLFMCEMIARLFPSGIRSPGCQKQFAHNFQKTGNTDIVIADNHATILVVFIWILLNGLVGALHMIGVLNDDFMLLLCSVFSVCDMICILFFCPFQTWFFKNRCCVTCRIYNWDFAMMFTPLFFVPGLYTWSLLGMSIILLAVWEITLFTHPERFSENTNAFLTCEGCTEQLCRHKKQLISLWKRNEQFFTKRIKFLK